MKLLVVESTTKAHKIWGILKYLYPNETWETIASLGHVRDLPEARLGIDEETLDIVEWESSPRQRKRLRFVTEKAQEAESIFLGTDPDREGEAIAWHLHDIFTALNIKVPIVRCYFHEITAKAIKNAVENPTKIDESLVEAQKARRTLDRLIGYKVSQTLSHRIGSGYSVGRVQAPALQFLALRERERNLHVPVCHWKVVAQLSDGNVATSDWYDNELKALEVQAYPWEPKAISAEISTAEIKSPPPLTTSKLIQEATRKLKISGDEVMREAQDLFESGLISYHRTDSIRMDWGFIGRVREFLTVMSPDSLSAKARNFPSEGAHEAIRPTEPTLLPSKLTNNVSIRGTEIYKLIWARALATQGSPVQMEHTRYGFGYKVDRRNIVIVAWITSSKMIDPGWHAACAFYLKPELTEVSPEATVESKKVDKGWTEPPRRYTEASLIQTLEDANIGRPSTYATIIPTLSGKQYIHQLGNTALATLKGQFTCTYLEQCFPELVGIDFTSRMEQSLDRIAQGNVERLEALKEIWFPIRERIAQAVNISTRAICPACENRAQVGVSYAGPYLYCEKCETKYGIDVTTGIIERFKETSYPGECKQCKSSKLETAQSKYGRYAWCKDCEVIQ